jgi:hypothetical protein
MILSFFDAAAAQQNVDEAPASHLAMSPPADWRHCGPSSLLGDTQW